jgi:GH25 family lysozyme M1 (1,4-beta-N-acetylmuramidase)
VKRGIDVSTYQGNINWMDVRSTGIDFAMIKATQGRSETAAYRDFTDSKFSANITGAHSVGIRCGVYHYLTAQTVPEAMKEAEYFLSVIEPFRKIISLYAAVDVESSKYLPNDKTLLTQIVFAFCSRVEAAGYEPMIYTNLDWMKNRLNDISAYPLWLALWRDRENVPTVKQFPSMRIWQWGTEAVKGIAGKPDANFMIAEKPKSETVETDKAVGGKKDTRDNTPSAWAEDDVRWAVENKIMRGDEKGDLMLHQPLTREQACAIAKRVYDLLIEDAADVVAQKLINALKEG